MARQMTVTLPATGRAAGLARQATRDALAVWQVAHLEETAVLLVSELVGNVLRHARTRALAMALCLDPEVTSLLIEVHDTDPHEPRPRTPATSTSPGSGSCSSRPWRASGGSARRRSARRSGWNSTPGSRSTTRSRGCRAGPPTGSIGYYGPHMACWRRTPGACPGERRRGPRAQGVRTMPLHERDTVRDQLADCVFVGRDLTRPVPKYTFPRDESLAGRRSRWCRTS